MNDKIPASDLGLEAKPPEVIKYNKKTVYASFGIIMLVIFFLFVLTGNEEDTNQQTTVIETNTIEEDYVPKVPNEYVQKISYDSKIHQLGPARTGDIGTGKYHDQVKAYTMVNADQIKKTKISDDLEMEHQARILEYKKELELQELEMQKQAINSDLVLTTYAEGGSSLLGTLGFGETGDDLHQPLDQYQKQNNQQGKSAFLNRQNSELNNRSQIEEIISPYVLVAGTLIPCNLITAINSDLPGPITAQVRENVFDSISGKHLLIPQGARLIGEYNSQISYGQNRLQLIFNRIIFPKSAKYPNGYSIKLDNFQGADLSGYNGLHDRVNHHFGRLLAGATLTSILSATTYNKSGDREEVESLKQKTYNSIGEQINQTGQEIVKKQLNIAPTITVRSGMPFNVNIVKDLTLVPRDLRG